MLAWKKGAIESIKGKKQSSVITPSIATLASIVATIVLIKNADPSKYSTLKLIS